VLLAGHTFSAALAAVGRPPLELLVSRKTVVGLLGHVLGMVEVSALDQAAQRSLLLQFFRGLLFAHGYPIREVVQ